MTMTIRLGRKKVKLVSPPPKYPYLGQHKSDGDIYLIVGEMPAMAPHHVRYTRYKVLVQNLSGNGPRSALEHDFEPYYEPVTLQTLKDQS